MKANIQQANQIEKRIFNFLNSALSKSRDYEISLSTAKTHLIKLVLLCLINEWLYMY